MTETQNVPEQDAGLPERTFSHVLRSALGMMLMLYGLSKIAGLQFQDYPPHLGRPLQELNGMQMVWAFFGFSRGYTISVGIVQVVACVLLFLRKTAAVGAIAYLTVMVNVVLIDLWYDVDRQATGMACALLFGILLWMWLERRRYFAVLNTMLATPEEMNQSVHHNRILNRILVPLLALALLFLVACTVSLLTNPVYGPLG